ncbi:IRC6 [Candida oxycetoniae]|uniref:Increased recombination centers protein 6 n=1 Tax=Candida oxycetoniae TaxID=497107 RepID=A0AAI9SUB2_9ASCO|nr:IRC6 [Candida oxycetoniae]KAI3403167.2 IRC6 [Candida oxycetoniae]
MEWFSSNHIFIVGPPHSGKLRAVKALSRHGKQEIDVGFENHGTIAHTTPFLTKYYKVLLSILVDEFPAKRACGKLNDEEKLKEFEKWATEFTSEGMKELRETLVGLLFTVNINDDGLEYLKEALRIFADIKNKFIEEFMWEDGFCAVLGSVPQGDKIERESAVEEIEDLVISHGLEFINMEESGVNAYKEKLGKDRLVELIECHEWSNAEYFENCQEYKKRKMVEFGLGGSNNNDDGDDDDDIELDEKSLAELIRKLTIVRERALDIPLEQRMRYADEMAEEFADVL